MGENQSSAETPRTVELPRSILDTPASCSFRDQRPITLGRLIANRMPGVAEGLGLAKKPADDTDEIKFVTELKPDDQRRVALARLSARNRTSGFDINSKDIPDPKKIELIKDHNPEGEQYIKQEIDDLQRIVELFKSGDVKLVDDKPLKPPTSMV